MSAESFRAPAFGEMRWENPPSLAPRRGRRPNPLYDAITQKLQSRPDAFALVGSFATYGKALNMQQLLQNRGCHVTTRRATEGDAVDVYAKWPSDAEIVQCDRATVRAEVVWRTPPAKRAGVRQSWEAQP